MHVKFDKSDFPPSEGHFNENGHHKVAKYLSLKIKHILKPRDSYMKSLPTNKKLVQVEAHWGVILRCLYPTLEFGKMGVY